MTSNRPRHERAHTNPFSSAVITFVCGSSKKKKKKKRQTTDRAASVGHLLTFPSNCLVQREANLCIMNSDLLSRVPALLPTGRLWRHSRQQPSADSSPISDATRLHCTCNHPRPLYHSVPPHVKQRDGEYANGGLWVNGARLCNENPTDNCTWPLTCNDK